MEIPFLRREGEKEVEKKLTFLTDQQTDDTELLFFPYPNLENNSLGCRQQKGGGNTKKHTMTLLWGKDEPDKKKKD